MGGQIEKQQDNNGCLSYWLSNTVTLLYLLQRNINCWWCQTLVRRRLSTKAKS